MTYPSNYKELYIYIYVSDIFLFHLSVVFFVHGFFYYLAHFSNSNGWNFKMMIFQLRFHETSQMSCRVGSFTSNAGVKFRKGPFPPRFPNMPDTFRFGNYRNSWAKNQKIIPPECWWKLSVFASHPLLHIPLTWIPEPAAAFFHCFI